MAASSGFCQRGAALLTGPSPADLNALAVRARSSVGSSSSSGVCSSCGRLASTSASNRPFAGLQGASKVQLIFYPARDNRPVCVAAVPNSNGSPGNRASEPGSSSGDSEATLSEKLARVRRRLGIADPDPGPEDGGNSWYEDWDPAGRYTPSQMENLADAGETKFRKNTINNVPRDKWITPLLDWDAVAGGLDLDQERSEQFQRGEALANKEESQTAIRFLGRLIAIPLVTGFVISRALADPILNFTLKNNPEAFAMTDIQKMEGAKAVHIEETRIRMDMAIGKIKARSEAEILMHLAEFAAEVQEEERHHNEETLITAVSDSISGMTLFGILTTEVRGRTALFNTMGRLFDGLSDIAKAVMIILVADTLLGYHSEEGWHGLIELALGRYGVEPSEEGVVIFVGIVPVLIDVFFKYWIFIGLNRISPGAVVTIKQIDRH